ncbi:MAG: peptidoglycan DD-metalloendopeptidase family protein [Candidatus Omnitrophota bacterium]
MLKDHSYISFFLFLLLMAGCATTEYVPSYEHSPRKEGSYHTVQAGETIWRIAQTYGVTMDEIIKANRIPNVAQIEKGQLIFIPGAACAQQVLLDENSLKPDEFSWPLKGKVVSYFGQWTKSGANKGINIQVDAGETVYASRGGRVVFADRLSGYGKTIILDHLDGYFTVYGQNNTLLANVGDTVAKGTPIANVAENTRLAYLHFEIRKNAEANNPLYYLP